MRILVENFIQATAKGAAYPVITQFIKFGGTTLSAFICFDHLYSN
jgi:hypothetical protein